MLNRYLAISNLWYSACSAHMKDSSGELTEQAPTSASFPRDEGGLPLFWGIAIAIVVHLYVLWPLKDLVRPWNDFAFVYAAGRAWLSGGSPYDVALWRSQWAHIYPSFAGLAPPILGAPSQPYLYPPHWAILAVPAGYVPWEIACRLWDSINVAAYFCVAVLLLKLSPATAESRGRPLGFWLCLSIMASNGAVRWTFWECQLSMLPTLGVVAAYWAWAQRRPVWVALGVFVALLKPQIGVLPVAYLALIGGMRGVAGGAAAAVAVGALSMLRVDWRLLPAQIRECIQLHMSISYNALDNFYSLSSLLARFGKVAFASQLAGFLVVGLLAWRLRKSFGSDGLRSAPLAQLAIACAACAAFVPLHGYDMVILSPIVFWAYTLRQIWLKAALFVLILLASRIHTWGTLHGIHPLGPWMTVTILGLSLYAWLGGTKPPPARMAREPIAT